MAYDNWPILQTILVELNDESACPTSKSVNVNTVSENAHKGKNVPYIFQIR